MVKCRNHAAIMPHRPTPNSEDAADPDEPSGWHNATTFFVDVIWAACPLFIIPTGALILLAAKLRKREHEQAGRK